ncbi:MAG: CPBP family intramembrane metalloprotease [Candidatus Omnitrophica bacterium]|nr:CPBP family intramembrane metalloprotease [Candidatus Omnitrophota bacterium]
MRFGILTFLISFILSLLGLLIVDLSWWRIFRRCVSISAALSLWYCIKHQERRTFRSFGLDFSAQGKQEFFFGLLLGLSGLAVMFFFGLSSDIYQIDVTENRQRLWRILTSFVPAALLVSVLEELVFRGMILQKLLPYSRSAAVLVSSVLYAAVHVKASLNEPLAWLELGGLTVLGVVLCISTLMTGRLTLAIGLHSILAYGARVNKLLISFPDPMFAWLVGTSRLTNGIINWVVLMVLGAIIVWWVRRRREGQTV